MLDQGLPKYLNSSETPLFHKGSTLYGLYHAKDAIRKADRVVVVEGYLDVIALAQHDVGYSVATLGTALTPDHVRALSRYTKNIVALFDGDDAGQKAAARSFEIFVEAGLLGRAAFLPKGDDPDSFVRSRGKAALEAVLESSDCRWRIIIFPGWNSVMARVSRARARSPTRLVVFWRR